VSEPLFPKAPDTRHATTGGRALQDECAKTFNISIGMQTLYANFCYRAYIILKNKDARENFFNLSAQDMTLQLKVLFAIFLIICYLENLILTVFH
jgi:hypothetical protein